MYTGYTKPFPVNRPLRDRERAEHLSRERQANIDQDEHASLIEFNSSFIEMIDRWFKVRGGIQVLFALPLLFAGCFGFIFFLVHIMENRTPFDWVLSVVGLILFAFGFALSVWFLFVKEFFSYTHYPIRLNRKNRTIYVFRHNGPNGVLKLPWESVYFHIGHGTLTDDMVDIRGEVLEGDTVKDTFAVGSYLYSESGVRETWEFIRRYMEEGPESLGEVEITASVSTSLKNAYIVSAARTGILNTSLRRLFFPFIAINTLTRWLVMKSCKSPVWPAEIEAECAIDSDDPYLLPKPDYFGQFAENNPNFDADMRQYKAEQDARIAEEREQKKK